MHRLSAQGILSEYVIEVEILPFCTDPTIDPAVLQLHPVYEDEEGRCYFRRSASLQPVSSKDHCLVCQSTHLQKSSHPKLSAQLLGQSLLQMVTSLVSDGAPLPPGFLCIWYSKASNCVLLSCIFVCNCQVPDHKATNPAV